MTERRRFSNAIAEGDGISVVAAVEDAETARAAEAQRAEALVITGDPAGVREATTLPILWRTEAPLERAAEVADAVTLAVGTDEGEAARLERLHAEALALGLECAVEVRTEEELEWALELVDPEIFLLAPQVGEAHARLELVLDVLAAVPAGKLAIADLVVTTEDEVHELERAGVDAVIAHAAHVELLAGEAPPEV